VTAEAIHKLVTINDSDRYPLPHREDPRRLC
jgi:hypothetical protein